MKNGYWLLFLLVGLLCFTSCESCKHNYEINKHQEATCQNNGIKIEICSLCGKEKETKLKASHNYVYKNCLDYETCTYCYQKNDTFVYHSTNSGICNKCGEYYVSKDNQLIIENTRHTQALQNLKSSYDSNIQSLERRIQSAQGACIYSKSECNSKIAALNQQIRQKESEMARLGSTSKDQALRINLMLTIQNLESEKLNYQRVLNMWNNIDSLKNQKNSLTNQYIADVEKENALHASNLLKINASRD